MKVISNPLVWCTVLAVGNAIILLMRGIRVINKQVFQRYFIFLACIWLAILVLPFAIPFTIIQASAAVFIVLLTVIVALDLLLSFFLWIKRIVAPEDHFIQSLPPIMLEICDALAYLAGHRLGCLVIIERKIDLDQYVGGGIYYDAEIKTEVLTALFARSSPVHDGAIIVAHDRIKRVKAVLPLSTSSVLPMGIGTRHRAAIGITEKTDSIALVASEERGEVSVAYRGILVKAESHKEVLKLLHMALKGRSLRRSPVEPSPQSTPSANTP